jgi:hypothetical protein
MNRCYKTIEIERVRNRLMVFERWPQWLIKNFDSKSQILKMKIDLMQETSNYNSKILSLTIVH